MRLKIHAPIVLEEIGECRVFKIYAHSSRDCYHMVGNAMLLPVPVHAAGITQWIMQWFSDYREYKEVM